MKSKRLKITVVALLAIGAMGFALTQWRSTQPPAQEPQAGSTRPSREEMQQQREQIMTEIGITEEQRDRLEQIREQDGDFRSQREAMRAVLTPEQQEMMRERMGGMRNQMMDRAREVLPPEQLDAFERKLEERRGQFGGPGGPGGRGGRPDRITGTPEPTA